MHVHLHPLLRRKACPVQREEDEAGGGLVFGGECGKLIRRHPDMHRPSKIVGHDDGSAVPGMIPITPRQLGQKLHESMLPQVLAIGQTPSRPEHMEGDLGHRVSQMAVAQSQCPQVRAL